MGEVEAVDIGSGRGEETGHETHRNQNSPIQMTLISIRYLYSKHVGMQLLLRHAACRNQHSSFRITLAPIFCFSRTADFLIEILDRYLSKSAHLYSND